MPDEISDAIDAEIEEALTHVDAAQECWQKFIAESSKIEGFIKSVSNDARATMVSDTSGQDYFLNCKISLYSDLDAAIESSGKYLELYIMEVHELKAAFDKAFGLMETPGATFSAFAGSVLQAGTVVESVLAQAVAAQAAWDKGLNAVMPPYRKFKLASMAKKL